MADEKYTFEQARIRLEEIAAEVRKKDTSLEKSLDLLEEGVRLANICTELVDHTDVSASVTAEKPDAEQPEVEQPSAGDDALIEEEGTVEDADGAAPQAANDTDDDVPEHEADGFDDVEEPAASLSDEDAED